MLLASCSPTKPDQELREEIKALKDEVNGLKEKLGQMEAGQQKVLEALARLEMQKPTPTQVEQAQGMPAPLTVSELFKNRDRFMGQRVAVKGEVGIVLIHRKSFYLKAPEGMVEVFFGNLRDKALVERLTSQTLTQPVTVIGVVSAAPGHDPGRLQLLAETVEF